jgi:hypothetical protein
MALAELAVVNMIGPVAWGDTRAAKVVMAVHIALYTYCSFFPLFLEAEDRPFGSALAQLATAGIVAGVAVPFASARSMQGCAAPTHCLKVCLLLAA